MKRILVFVAIGAILLLLCACQSQNTHTYSSEWKYDEAMHWKECVDADCKSITAQAEHSFDELKITRPADSDNDGEGIRSCEVCDAKRIEAIEKLPHTCCFDGRYSSNSDAHWLTCKTCSKKSASTDHTWDSGSIILEATSDAEGEILYTCTVCERSQIKKLNRLPDKMSEDEWRLAFEFNNVRIKKSIFQGTVGTYEAIYSIDGNLVCSSEDESIEYFHRRDLDILVFSDNYSSFSHLGDGIYYAKKVKIGSDILSYHATDVTVKFSDGKISVIEASTGLGSLLSSIKETYMFYDHGCVSLDPRRLSDAEYKNALDSRKFESNFQLEYGIASSFLTLRSHDLTVSEGEYVYQRYKNSTLVEVKKGQADGVAVQVANALESILAEYDAKDFIFSESRSTFVYAGEKEVTDVYIDIKDGRIFSIYCSLPDGSYTYADIIYD